jgi:hypothetical protein
MSDVPWSPKSMLNSNKRFKEQCNDPSDEYEDQENPNNLLGFTASKLCYAAVRLYIIVSSQDDRSFGEIKTVWFFVYRVIG